MKQNKKNQVKEGWNLPNGVVWIGHSSVVGKGKTNGLCKKEMIVVILSMK